MTRRYYAGSEDNKEEKITYADGTYETIKMSVDYGTCVFVVIFYDENGDPVTPTAGTIKPECYTIDGQKMEPGSGDITIDATEVIASSDGVATYSIPAFLSITEKAEVTFDGVTGVDSFVAFFWKQ